MKCVCVCVLKAHSDRLPVFVLPLVPVVVIIVLV